MKADDRGAFLEIVFGFAELKGRTLSAAGLELYWHALTDWSLEEFKAAAAHLLGTCEFMPTPKNFEDLRRAGRPTAGEAFALAWKHAGSGAYRDGPLGDERIDRVVDTFGGYRMLAMTPEASLPFVERRFCDHYEAQQDATDVREALPQIARDGRGALTRRLAPAGQLARALQLELQPKQPRGQE